MKKKISLLLVLMLMIGSFSALAAELTKAQQDCVAMYTHFENGRYAECLAYCEEVLAQDDTFMEAYYLASVSAFYLGDTQKAYDILQKQLSVNPKNELALYNGACAAAVLGKEEESVTLLDRLLDLDITEKSKIKADADFDSVRDNPIYQQLMEISVLVGGERVAFDVAPIIIEGRTLLPMRRVFECLGAVVSFDDATQTAIAEKNGISLQITIGSKTAKVNGEEKELDVPAMLKDGRTLVPVRFVSEALQAEVLWDGENEVVDIRLPMPDGTGDYAAAKKALDEAASVLPIDGAFPEPYMIPQTQGIVMIVLPSEEDLSLFGGLSIEDKKRYLAERAYESYGEVLGCEPVFTRIVYDGKMYYEANFDYNQKDTVFDLTYYAKGKPVNVVKQYKADMNYKEF